MSAAVCSSCGTAHGPAQRYCLGCGALVGERSVEIDQAIAYAHDRTPTREPIGEPAPAPIEEPAPAPAADISVWRRPVTSIATALALAAGVTAGFLTAPQGGVARSGAPVVLSGAADTTTTTTADSAPAQDAPTDDVTPEADETLPAPGDEEASDDAGAAPGPGDATTTPVSNDGGASPVAADPADSKPKTEAKAKAKPKTKAKTAADGLPKIDHIWVIGTDAPLAPVDGSYVGDVLLSRATELPKYTPTSTDPLIGAAALVAGREPSANAKTIVDQLTTAKRSWRAYGPGTPSCTDSDTPGGIPLLSFPTVTSAPDCADRVGSLADIPADLSAKGGAPAFSYIATDPTLDPAALDAQLKQLVEPIRRSAAYKQAGLIVVVPTAADPIKPTGALVLSPFAEGSTSIGTAFGPYSLLRTFADLLGLDRPGHAADKDVAGLGPDILVPKD